jgi:hypothetical protein
VLSKEASKSTKRSFNKDFIIIDTKVPQVNLIGTPPEWSNYDTGSFHWTSDENATYECAIDLAESGTPCGSGTNRRWMSTRLADGEHTFYLFATDLNGNQAPPIEYKWNIGMRSISIFNENCNKLRIF